MKTILRNNKYLICAILFLLSGLTGCGTAQPEMKSDGYSFATGAENISDTFYCYRTKDRQTAVLDYDSMNTSLLCTKPNCSHTGDDCIVKRLNGNVPMFDENSAYYFVDAQPEMIENDEGKADLKLSSALYQYDLSSNSEKKIMQIDGKCVAFSNHCWMLRDKTIYFIEDTLGRNYDENGSLLSSHNSGGNLSLHAIHLNDLQDTELCELYSVKDLTEVYPMTPNSGGVFMQGVFDNKIFFNVCFLEGDESSGYTTYVTYYDLTDGSYHGTPEDYHNIDFAEVKFLSDDYLVIRDRKNDQEKVYCKGSSEPVILSDPVFQGPFVCAYDDTLYCYNKAFDLNTKESRTVDILKENRIVTKNGNSFILTDNALSGKFQKVSASKLLK